MTILIDENDKIKYFRRSTSSSESQLRFVFVINLNFKFIMNTSIINQLQYYITSACVDTVESNLAKTDQYSRRSTVLVTGLDYHKESETYQNLSENVASKLSKSGVKLSNSDFAACHRNRNKIKTVKRSGQEIKTPPSITVKFVDANKKDCVLKGYKNFEGGKPKKVKFVQSLNNYYQDLKYNISNLCRENGDKVLWIHWRSSSPGLCIKLEGGRYFAKVHSMRDLTNRYFSG